MKPIRTKICGITRVEDALTAAEAGADAIGLNFYALSKRFIEADSAKPIADALRDRVALVGVFVNSTLEEVCDIAERVGLSHIQFHGDELPTMVAELKSKHPNTLTIRAVRVREDDFEAAQSEIDQWQDAGIDAVLLDAASIGSFGGTGKKLNWGALEQLTMNVPWLLAGGLDCENVADAIATCNPDGVDVASGVESSPGIKDAELVRKFVQNSTQK